MKILMSGKIIGILGGMGPEATIDLYYRIIRATPAKKDQEHIKTIIYSNPKISDRTNAILFKGISPLPELITTALSLQKAGADFLIMPRNTAHYFIEPLKKSVDIPILNMIKITSKHIHEKFSYHNNIGLLATDGTIRSNIYQKSLKKDKEFHIPDNKDQKLVMSAIYEHIKAGKLESGKHILNNISEKLRMSGANIIIAGCTEISLVLKNGDLEIPILDPLQLLAEYAVKVALNNISFKNLP